MSTTVSIDQAGRIVIPKAVREELHLEPGDTLQLESEGDTVKLRPIRSSTPLIKKRGVWVFRTGSRLSADTVDKTIGEIRANRDRTSAGGEG